MPTKAKVRFGNLLGDLISIEKGELRYLLKFSTDEFESALNLLNSLPKQAIITYGDFEYTVKPTTKWSVSIEQKEGLIIITWGNFHEEE